jgi:hypothetical protein
VGDEEYIPQGERFIIILPPLTPPERRGIYRFEISISSS